MPDYTNQQGIIATRFLPTFGESPDIGIKVRELFQKSEKIRASIAFWTLSFQDLLSLTNDFNVLQPLKSDDSFLCCDIQLPTNIDALATLKQAGIDVSLNFRRLIPAVKKETSSLGLLHTKMILADKKDGSAEIWVGSHNWTQFALRGINTEISLVLTVEQHSAIYCEAYQYLKHIRSFCDNFDLDNISLYKRLQTKNVLDLESESVIIELEGAAVDSLAGTSIWMFGTEDKDYQSLRRVGSDVKLILHDTFSGKKHLYDAMIIQTGQMEAYNSYASGLDFVGHKRHAFSEYRGFPVLQQSGPVPAVVLYEGKFFVAVQVMSKKSENFEVQSVTENKFFLWEDAVSDPVLSVDAVRSWYREAARGRRYEVDQLIQVPYFKAEASQGKAYGEEYLLQPLEVKRERREYDFVSKGVIRIL